MLADVLEFPKPKLKAAISAISAISSKDESDLFNIANNFSIRHHNQQQKIEYDQDLGMKLVLYIYLATIRFVIGRLEKIKAD